MTDDVPPATSELRTFGLLAGALTAGIFGLILPYLRRHPFVAWPWSVGAALICAALVWPASLRYVHWLWVRFAVILGWINSRIVLTILFFLVILPTGLLMRALGRSPVARKLDPNASTYRVPSRSRAPKSMERPF